MIQINILEEKITGIFHQRLGLAKRFIDGDWDIKSCIGQHINLLLYWYKQNYRFCHYMVINKVILIKIHDI